MIPTHVFWSLLYQHEQKKRQTTNIIIGINAKLRERLIRFQSACWWRNDSRYSDLKCVKSNGKWNKCVLIIKQSITGPLTRSTITQLFVMEKKILKYMSLICTNLHCLTLLRLLTCFKPREPLTCTLSNQRPILLVSAAQRKPKPDNLILLTAFKDSVLATFCENRILFSILWQNQHLCISTLVVPALTLSVSSDSEIQHCFYVIMIYAEFHVLLFSLLSW